MQRANLSSETNTKDVLIIGGSGQLSVALLETLGTDRAASCNRSEAGHLYADLLEIANHPEVGDELLVRVNPRCLIICAGLTNVEFCEGERELAFMINSVAPRNLARAASQLGIRTVYISTEYVFDGRNGPYDEDALVNPLSVYGASKLQGEEGVLENDPSSLVVRTTVVYGPDLRAKNFAYQVVQHLISHRPLRVPSDQISTPTYNRDLAKGIKMLIDDKVSGVVHIAGPERLSRSDLAFLIAEALSLPSEYIQSVVTSELSQKAVRPLSAGLITQRLSLSQAGLMMDVTSAFRHWLSHPGGATPAIL